MGIDARQEAVMLGIFDSLKNVALPLVHHSVNIAKEGIA